MSDVISEFIKLYPEVYVSLDFTNHAVDLIENGIDIDLDRRHHRGRNLIVRRLVQFDMTLCASPAYWAQRGLPHKPEDMSRHDMLSYSAKPTTHLPFITDGRSATRCRVHSRMEANDAIALIELALRGVGVAYVPAPLAQSHLDARRAGAGAGGAPAEGPVALRCLPRSAACNSAAMRAMLDFLEKSMAPGVEPPMPPPAGARGAAYMRPFQGTSRRSSQRISRSNRYATTPMTMIPMITMSVRRKFDAG